MRNLLVFITVVGFVFLSGFSDVDPIVKVPEKSIGESYSDAKNNISDIPIEDYSKTQKIFATEKNTHEKKTLNSNIYKTAQILETNTQTGEELVAITTFQGVDTNRLNENGDHYKEQPDGSHGIVAYSRIYYTVEIGSDNIPYAKLTKVIGGWRVGDHSIALSNRIVRYGTLGFPLHSHQKKVKYPTSNSYTYYALSSWEPVNANALNHIGTNSEITLKKAGSSWDIYLENRYNSGKWMPF